MDKQNIKNKIYKYQTKLNKTNNVKKQKLYQQKLNYYKSIMKGGENKFINYYLNEQKKQAEQQIIQIKKNLEQPNMNAQMNDLLSSSEELKDNYKTIGDDLKKTINSYSSTLEDLANDLKGIKSINVSSDIKKVQNTINAVPKTLDEIIIYSLAAEKIKNIDISKELKKYNIDPKDIEIAIEKIKKSYREKPKEEKPKEEKPKEEKPKEEKPKEEKPKEEKPKEEKPKEDNLKEEKPKEDNLKEEKPKEVTIEQNENNSTDLDSLNPAVQNKFIKIMEQMEKEPDNKKSLQLAPELSELLEKSETDKAKPNSNTANQTGGRRYNLDYGKHSNKFRLTKYK